MILTIDIGGSEIKSAVYQASGESVAQFASRPTAVSATDNQIEAQVVALTKEAAAQYPLKGVAISTSGVVNPHSGAIIFAGPTIPNYIGCNLKTAVEQQCGLPCSVENDVNAMALGEAWLGAAKDCDSALCIALGTGLGGALLMGGKVWHGNQFSAGEVGQAPIGNGLRLEDVASTTSLLKHYEQASGEKINGKVLFERLKAGEAQAAQSFRYLMEQLTTGLLPAIYLFAPQAIIVGGGISAQREFLEPYLRQAISERLSFPHFMPQQICCAALGNDANMLGALRWFLDSDKE